MPIEFEMTSVCTDCGTVYWTKDGHTCKPRGLRPTAALIAEILDLGRTIVPATSAMESR